MIGYDYVAVPLQHVMFAIEARPEGGGLPTERRVGARRAPLARLAATAGCGPSGSPPSSRS